VCFAEATPDRYHVVSDSIYYNLRAESDFKGKKCLKSPETEILRKTFGCKWVFCVAIYSYKVTEISMGIKFSLHNLNNIFILSEIDYILLTFFTFHQGSALCYGVVFYV